jgi:NDP-4-keto-2,6-dideoxyhexose 3-C-methyltransferase
MRITEQKECRICKGELERVLDLGNIYPSGFLKDDEKVSEDMKAPLILDRCKECGLVQLEHTIDLDSMYKKQYWYSSGLNKSMVSSLYDIVMDIERKITLDDGDTVVDIGCNDGTLLSQYSLDLVKIGFDPAPNLSCRNCDMFVNDYFDANNYMLNTKAKVITAIAMFYDLPDPNKFVADVKSILSDDGIFVIQFTDLLSMFKATAFDNICHEHLEYYRLEDVMKLLRSNGLDVIDVSYNDVNGGSVRITACHDGAYLPSYSVASSLTKEHNFFLENTFETFKNDIEKSCEHLGIFVYGAKVTGKKTILLGASTKGNTLLQICQITEEFIPYAAEVNKEKFGLRTIGSNIKIISEDEALAINPDYFVVPVWHFENNLLANEKIRNYINNGGYLIFPLPVFHVVGKDDLKDD